MSAFQIMTGVPGQTPGTDVDQARMLAAAQAQVFQLQMWQQKHAEQVIRLTLERDEAVKALRLQEAKNRILVEELESRKS